MAQSLGNVFTDMETDLLLCEAAHQLLHQTEKEMLSGKNGTNYWYDPTAVQCFLPPAFRSSRSQVCPQSPQQ
jgi:hypothetical protein